MILIKCDFKTKQRRDNFVVFGIFSDIQEFYECTLLDDSKDVNQKTLETLQMVNRWEKDQPVITSTLKHEVTHLPRTVLQRKIEVV